MLLPSLPVADPFNIFREYAPANPSSLYFHQQSGHLQSCFSGLGAANSGVSDISDSHNLKRIVFIFAPLPIFVPWLFLSPPTIILPIVPSPASCEMNPNSEDDKRDKTKVAIRSQLLCFKEGLTTTQLNNWYRSFFKTPIAQTTGEIETWLAKQSDLCRSKGKTVAGEKLWVGVPTQETKHVSDLIANQKSSKAKKSKRISKQSGKFASKSAASASPAQKELNSSNSKNNYRPSYGNNRKAGSAKQNLSRRSSNASNASQAFQKRPAASVPLVPVCSANSSAKKSHDFDRRSTNTRVFNGFYMEKNHKEYESTPISIGGGISRKEDPRQSSSATEKSFVGDTSSPESSDVESYDKSAIISSVVKKAHENMRRTDSVRSSQECPETNDAALRRNDSVRSMPGAFHEPRPESMRSRDETFHDNRAESIRDDVSVARSDVSTIRRKHGIQQMREFLVEALKEFENGMLLTELHAHMNDGFMSRVLNRRGITQEKFINVLSTFDEIIVEDGRVYLATEESTEEEEETEDEESSESDSGTDVSEVGMFDVPKPQTTVQKIPATESHAKPLVSFNKAREVYDAKQELTALRLVDAELNAQLATVQRLIAENKEKIEASQEKYERVADEFVEGYMKAF